MARASEAEAEPDAGQHAARARAARHPRRRRRHLGYTPGAVSQHLASLEATLGVALVERSGRHLVLTDAGRVMAEHAEELLTAESRAVSATRSAHDAVAGPLVIGTWGSTAATLLAPIVQRMSARSPRCTSARARWTWTRLRATSGTARSTWRSASTIADAPMPRDKSIQLVRLRPERVRRRGRCWLELTIRASPKAQHVVVHQPPLRTASTPTWVPLPTWTGSCRQRPPSTVARSAQGSDVLASSQRWSTRSPTPPRHSSSPPQDSVPP